MSSTSSFVVFLVVGAALVFVDGQLIRRSGTTYLRSTTRDSAVADSVNQLVAVVFHLAALGLLALISVLPMDLGSEPETVVARLGLLLLVLALAHSVTIWTLGRIRTRQQSQLLQEEVVRAREDATRG
ncbi:hypothetical protein [Saccharopolyspora phatthalungensis]|uniref:Protein-S-isoprenylcysteine O-methyltransferase Ste14 n=1 Tax=Saccharopolyspora phatthalungensis TaxID=664693 RepID=A0A840QBZ4_9PSEU|nr:hypothetical protein [Saccharopolyspora phatthalungensis]MBB5154393.1 protein-S-isoprenylcysteine O-methyltransferase Ste14 [Saccharopolyspora phatthalungensis]